MEQIFQLMGLNFLCKIGELHSFVQCLAENPMPCKWYVLLSFFFSSFIFSSSSLFQSEPVRLPHSPLYCRSALSSTGPCRILLEFSVFLPPFPIRLKDLVLRDIHLILTYLIYLIKNILSDIIPVLRISLTVP